MIGLAAALGADDALLRDLRRAALLHDIGKLAISNRILDKPARLTRAEFARVREHPLITERILAPAPRPARTSPRSPAPTTSGSTAAATRAGSRGDELTLPMRVLAIADVYEALTSERPYRRAMTSGEALAIMRADVPGRLDRERVRGARAGARRRHRPPQPDRRPEASRRRALGVIGWTPWTDSRTSPTSARRSSACSGAWA